MCMNSKLMYAWGLLITVVCFASYQLDEMRGFQVVLTWKMWTLAPEVMTCTYLQYH